jgi:lipopolysaccharide biosynthesis regulator YciM
MSEPNDPKQPGRSAPGAGSSGGEGLSDDSDFETDALLDGLLFDDPTTSVPTPVVPAPKPPLSLLRPSKREYSEDDVTVVGRTEDLFAGVVVDDGTTGLEDLARSDISELLSSIPSGAASEPVPNLGEPPARLPDIPAAPRLPAVPTTVPRPVSRLASNVPRPSLDATAKPPAINPAGPPPRQPFPPAMSPRAPSAALSERLGAPKATVPRPGSSTSSVPPPPGPLQEGDDDDEHTRVYIPPGAPPSGPSPAHTTSPPPESVAEAAPDDNVLPDPFFTAATREAQGSPSTMPTLQQHDPSSRLPTVSVPKPAEGASEPAPPARESLPTISMADGDFELFPETPGNYGSVSLDVLDEPHAEPSDAELFRPATERPALAPSLWPDERPAREHLNGQQEAFAARAEWLQREAQSARDPQAKVRALIVASELWALLGDPTRAREVASEANSVARAPAMAARQLRSLAAAEADFKAVTPLLELEIRGAASAEARVHAAYLSAEVHRLVLQDDASAKKKLDLAVRAQPDDPRAYVAKLADLLGKSSGPARIRLPESEAFSELVRASEELLRLRGAPGTPGSVAPAAGPRAAFDEARRALSAGDREKTAEALQKLGEVAGLGSACAWLSACLLGVEAKTRARAIATLSELAAKSGSRLARRALVTRALEQGDAQAVREAVDGPQGELTFAAPDRLALAALTGLDSESLSSSVWEVAGDAELRPLAAAFVATSANAARDVRAGSERSRIEQRLGQTLVTRPTTARDLDFLRPDAQAFEATHPESPLSRLLALEFARSAGATSQVALALANWPQPAGDSDAARDQYLAAALVFELAEEQAPATLAYRHALEQDATSEATVRALASAVPEETTQLLLALSDHLAPSPRSALTLLEAAFRQDSAPQESYDALIDRARLADPELPLSYRLAEMTARLRGDGQGLLRALRARREAADDPIERSLDLVREALLVAESDLPLAERLLDEAQEARPTDLALHELRERMVPTGDAERARFREALAEGSEGLARGRLFVEAALERTRASDYDAATRDAFLAADNGAGELARVMAERLAGWGTGATQLAESLLERARTSENAVHQRELYERLSQLDRARGDHSSALLWQTAILEQSPQYLPALRRLEHAYLDGDRLEELELVVASLAHVLDAAEANGHARLAARLRVRRGAWAETRELAELAISHAPDELWALRTLSAHARAAEDSELGFRVDQRLFELCDGPLDKATLALRAAEAAARLERPQDTQRLLRAALEQVPDHLLALTTLSEVLEAAGEPAAAAQALERAAQASHVPAHQVSAWYQAAVLWLDSAGDGERGRAALESAVALDVNHENAVARLQALYITANERQKLAALLERRLEHTTDPEQRIAIEVARGRALAEVGEKDAAKAALAAALGANPDHAEALEAFAGLCLEEGDWASGEQALIRLARRMSDPQRQAQIYRRLGELYDTALPNAERAELAYKEVLKRDPEDGETVARLVHVYGRLGDKATALSLQTDLLSRAKTAEEKRDRTLALAIVEEQIVGERKRAEQTFDKLRKEYPYDSAVLRAVAEFQQRGGETRAMHVLLDRAATDARRALATGRFEPAFFEILATVAELKHAGDTALVARATLAALHGEELPVPAAGPIAGDPRLDDLLAPDLVSPPLRALLKKSGDILDAAYPVDLRALRAAPLPLGSAAFTSYVQQVAVAFGIRGLEVFASAALGPVCMPVSTNPPQLVFGQALLDSEDDAARYFLLIRCLKILQGSAAALSRTAPVELWPILAGFLNLFAPNWIPQGVDAKKLADAQKRISSVLRSNLDDDVPVLALEVIGAIGNRASLLGTALHQWGNRTALLSAGSLVASLRGVALAAGQPGAPPREGAERVKWIVRNPEARDLATYGVSEQYTEARTRLGLSR